MLANQFKTVLLLAIMSALLLLVGQGIGGSSGMTIALIMALIMNIITYFYSDKIVLAMYGAKPLDQDRYLWVYQIIQSLCQQMQLPMPKLWLIETSMANAFATGRNPEHASVAITTGILDILNEQELRGVLAHELGHVKNRDILIATIAATIATAISYIANMARFISFWGSSDDNRQTNPLAAIMIAIFMPIAAMIIQMAISRSREYMADETGAHYSHDPLALASALEKLQTGIKFDHLNAKTDLSKSSTASLFIVYPFSAERLMGLFSTHPPMHERIKRLRQMHEKMFN